MKRMNFPGRKEQRKIEGEARQALFNELPTETKIARALIRGNKAKEGKEVEKWKRVLKLEKRQADKENISQTQSVGEKRDQE